MIGLCRRCWRPSKGMIGQPVPSQLCTRHRIQGAILGGLRVPSAVGWAWLAGLVANLAWAGFLLGLYGGL